MRRVKLELAVMVSGGAVMVFELTGSRILAPHVGTSIVVWASLLGVILGSLSVGYWLGGRLSDRRPSASGLAAAFVLAGVLIAACGLVKESVLGMLDGSVLDVRWRSMCASLLLFALPSMALGAVLPYAVKLKLTSLASSGSTVGKLYAISTLGSISGTLLAGFVLIPLVGTTQLLLAVGATLAVTATIIAPSALVPAAAASVAVLALGTPQLTSAKLEFETQYSSVRIQENMRHLPTGRRVKIMSINRQASSAMYYEGEELVYAYTRFFRLADHFNPTFSRSLMLGGAGYSFPKAYLAMYPSRTMDVVELDPGLTRLAKDHFRLKESPRLGIHHTDARVYLEQTRERYDVIFGDVFRSVFSIPFHLMTREAVERIHERLDDRGVAIINFVSSATGPAGALTSSLAATYQSIFPWVYLFLVDHPDSGDALQNVILVAVKSDKEPSLQSYDPRLQSLLRHLWREGLPPSPVLTDDYAPVDYFLGRAIWTVWRDRQSLAD